MDETSFDLLVAQICQGPSAPSKSLAIQSTDAAQVIDQDVGLSCFDGTVNINLQKENPHLRGYLAQRACAPITEASTTVRALFVITALFEFTRASAQHPCAGLSASTDSHAVLVNWSMADERSFDLVLDLPELLVANLTWNEHKDATSNNDLDAWCRRLSIARSAPLRVSCNEHH